MSMGNSGTSDATYECTGSCLVYFNVTPLQIFDFLFDSSVSYKGGRYLKI